MVSVRAKVLINTLTFSYVASQTPSDDYVVVLFIFYYYGSLVFLLHSISDMLGSVSIKDGLHSGSINGLEWITLNLQVFHLLFYN